MRQPARDRPGAGRRLSRPPRARLSRRLHPLAGAVAQAAGRALGRPRAVGGAAPRLRPRARDRDLRAAGILVARRDARDAATAASSRRASSAPTASKITAARHRQRRAEAEAFSATSSSRRFTVATVEAKPAKRHPAPPFTTSTLQQEASRKLGFAPAQHHAARAAPLRRRRHRRRDGRPHHLYADRRRRHGAGGDRRRRAASSARNTATATCRTRRAVHDQGQERPGGARGDPADRHRAACRHVARYLEADQARLYELIWKRTIASQMESAELERTTVDIAAEVGARKLDLRATGQVVMFDGFLPSTRRAATTTARTRTRRRLPPMSAGEPLEREAHRRRPSTSPSRRRATPRRAWSSAWRSSASAGPRPTPSILAVLRDRDYVAHRQEALRARGQGPARHRLPRELLQPLRRVRLHRRPRREARPDLQPRARLEGGAARLLEGLLRRDRRDQGAAHRPRCSTR